MPGFANPHQFTEFVNYLELGLTDVYEDELKAHPKLYPDWLSEVTAKEWTEDEIVITGLGPMPTKDIGGNFETDKKITSDPVDFSLTPYGLGVVIEYELSRWEKYNVFGDFARELSGSATDRLNILAYSILNYSFSTADANYTIYNGEAICNNAHARLDGGSWKNLPDTPVALSYLGIQQGRTDMALTVNERGRYVRTQPEKLICSEQNRWIADTIVQTSGRPGTADNDTNTVAKWGLSIHSSPYLTTSAYYWLFGPKDQIKKAIKMRIGEKPNYRQDYDRSSWNVLMATYMSAGVRVLEAHGIWGSTGGA